MRRLAVAYRDAFDANLDRFAIYGAAGRGESAARPMASSPQPE